MPAFSLTPLAAFPGPADEFPTGTQFEINGAVIGPPDPARVNLAGSVTATYDPITGRITYTLAGGGGGGATVFSVGAGGFYNPYVQAGPAPPTRIGFDAYLFPDYESGFENFNGPIVNEVIGTPNYPVVFFEWRGFKPICGVFLVNAITQQRELPAGFTSSEARDYLAWPVDLSEGFSSIGGGFAGQAFAKLIDPDNIAGNGTLLNTFSLTDTGTIIRFNWLGGVTDAIYLIQLARSTNRPY